jgi:adenine-specific DNA-methyltransferase
MAGLTFKGKSFVQNYHLLVKYHQLIPRKDKSLTDKVSLRDNLIIHGDNLKALKALLPMYGGKVKCIYIDPPYNTGNENWPYNDNVNSPMMQDWLGKVVDREDLTRHDKWLCMMMPRLKILHDLLADRGVIFISADDNEVHRLRCLGDEVFGEHNFVCNFVWHSRGHTDNQFQVKINHEHILCYAKRADSTELGFVVDPSTRKESNLWKGLAENSITKNGPGNPPSEVTLPAGFPCRAESLNLPRTKIPPGLIEDLNNQVLTSSGLKRKYPGVAFPLRLSPMHVKDFRLTKPCKVLSGWANLKKLSRFIESACVPIPDGDGEELTFYLSENGVVYYRRDRERARNILSVLQDFGTTEQQRSELETIGISFKYPKPKSLIQHLIQIGAADPASIVLDSFAGSGTTAHGVLQQNAEDGGRRRFILIECEDYAEKVTAERVRRVIKGVARAKDENLRRGLSGTFSYFDLGPAIEMESILSGDSLPTYRDLARYVFYTATGEEFDETAVDEKRSFIGESKQYLVYLFYAPDLEYLKTTALTLDRANALGPYAGKRRLVFAPTKYLDQDHLDERRIDFAQLPFEIYQLVK